MVAGGRCARGAGYLFAASTLALAVVLYFEYVSFVVLKAVCILCLVDWRLPWSRCFFCPARPLHFP